MTTDEASSLQQRVVEDSCVAILKGQPLSALEVAGGKLHAVSENCLFFLEPVNQHASFVLGKNLLAEIGDLRGALTPPQEGASLEGLALKGDVLKKVQRTDARLCKACRAPVGFLVGRCTLLPAHRPLFRHPARPAPFPVPVPPV